MLFIFVSDVFLYDLILLREKKINIKKLIKLFFKWFIIYLFIVSLIIDNGKINVIN